MARASFTHYIPDDSALGGMEIERSLRFDKANSSHLSKTFSSAGNRKVWTWSAWIRRAGNYGSSNTMFHAYDGSSSNRAQISFDTGNRLIVHQGGGGGSKGQTRTDRRFRDSNWYHIVCVANFADSTAADRVKMYVNGVLETKTIQVAFTDENGLINSNLEHELGAVGSSSNNFDGYMAEINFIDGQNLDPSYFGYSDFQTGKWRPKRYEGTYGQNGFHLEFKDNSGATATTIGKDTSGNQHNFTPANIAVSNDWQHNDSFIDTPTNTFPILSLNTVYRVYNSSSDVYNGGMKYNCHYDNQGSVRAALTIPTSGKWYWEERLLTSNANATFGICNAAYSKNQNAYTQTTTPGSLGYAAYSQILKDGSTTGGVGGWGTSDTVALALDMDEKKITFYKNNSAQITLALLSGYENIPYFPMLTGGTNGGTVNLGINFGGNESLAYTPPEGFKTLCTRNLPTTSPSVYNPKKHFDTVIYTGDGATGRSVTGLQFQPDFVWIKSRASGHHGIYDSIRGVQKRVIADENGAESDVPIGSFDHNGFSFASEMYYNANSVNYVAWFWKAGGTAVSNSDGTITSSVSTNQEAGFSVVTYTGTGADATVGHGLGKVPAIVMVKNRSRSVEWIFKHHKMNSGKVMYLDLNDGEDGATGSNNGIIGDLNNASTFSLSRTSNSGNYNNVNYSGENFVAYCWAEIRGYSKFGLFNGNGAAPNGSYIHTGFKVGWLMIKKASGSGDWFVLDGKRSPTNEVLKSVKASTNAAETTDSNFLDFLSNGFMMRTTGSAVNQNTLIYMAFADTSGNTPFDTETNAR